MARATLPAGGTGRGTGLPEELKIALIRYRISFSGWCRFYGFNPVTARNVAAAVIKGLRGKSEKIRHQLETDFPQLIGGKAHDANDPRWEKIRQLSYQR